ncbi:MAG TPA: lytic transglycosylase domain-containing protein [Croceibacterium sp.]|nr:lytic transglycosylase domain-containing protein [Croceibacterium sp.]
MSSMVRNVIVTALLASAALGSPHVAAQGSSEWDLGRTSMVATQPSPRAASAISQWQMLSAGPNFTFDEYAGFLLANPGFPDEAKLRGFAEDRLARDYPTPDRMLAYFDRFPPLTNGGRAQLALAMMASRPTEAATVAREAWRGGGMSETAYATIFATYAGSFTPEDHDARMDALLWQRDAAAAARQLPYVSPDKIVRFRARLAIIQGGDGTIADAGAASDPGYLYNRSRELRTKGRPLEAVMLLASRPALSAEPLNPTAWVDEHLNVARMADARSAHQIAARAGDAFANPDAIAEGSYKLRDDYTSLMWLGGTRALWDLGDGRAAAPLFYHYGAAARTPQTRSKGFFWAGNASAQAGDQAEARRYYEMAAAYPEYFYGLLALERLGRPAPSFAAAPPVQPTPEQRAAISENPLAQAIRVMAGASYPWQTKRKFYTELSAQARSPEELALVGELAQTLNLPELAVVVGRVAPEKGFPALTQIGFPAVATPGGADWTMVHAISRQESEFDLNRVSHAGAQGLMQLMPGTAREQAGKLGIVYMSASVMGDPQYNIQLGNGYFVRMLNTYGSYPLAVAAYNAGPGNVNKWLRANGDPRNGSINWIDWIERIPIFETRNYVQRVLENAVVYENLHPDKATQGRPRALNEFLR